MFPLIPLLSNLVGGFFKSKEAKTEIKKIKEVGAIKLAQTQVDAAIVRAQSDSESAGSLDRIALEQVGWKDEFLMIIVCIPLIMAFIPPMVPYVKQGFIALEAMPMYYQYMVGGVFIYVFGFKRILLKVLNKFIEKRL